jgi:uncharacterized membrane protein YfcA
MTKATIKIDDKYISVVEYLRKKYKNNFDYFFLYGFSVMNVGIVLGLEYITQDETEFLWLFLLQPVIVMIFVYHISFQLFNFRCQSKLKDKLHYTFITELILGFFIGCLYALYPCYPLICILIAYSIVTFMQLKYWKTYTKEYCKSIIKLIRKK